jgi:hypothetical protein
MSEKDFREKYDAVAEKALASLGLDLSDEAKQSKNQPANEGGRVSPKLNINDVKAEEETEVVDEETQSKEEVEVEKPQEEKSKEDSNEGTEEPEEVKEDEELIPKSKFEKVKDRLERRINHLTSQLKQQEQARPTLDSTKEKLEQLSERELISLEDEIDDSIFEARQAGDTAKLSQLKNLRREVRDVSVNAPKRFVDKQIQAYESSANNILNDPENDDIDFDKESDSIKKIATQIYQNKPDLQQLVRGQALALELAVEYYRETKKLNQGKDKEASLKRELVKQKQKTTLGSSKSTGTPRVNVDIKKSFEAAKKSGSDYEKAKFLGKVLDVDEYLR